MTTIAFIGSGNIGGTVARLSVQAGYDVVLSNSRGPETLKELVDELGPKARAATPAQAAAAGDLVVVSIPLRAYPDVPVEPLAGKTVLDTGNYYPQRDGDIPQLADGSTTSSELLQQHLPTSKVVKVFNNIYSEHLRALARPAGADRTALPIAGDDAAAKEAVTAFLDAIGYDAVDAGPLAESWRFQPGTPVYGNPYAGGNPNFWESPGVPAGTTVIREALDAAELRQR
ncbi:(AJ250023) putative polyketide synthase [[Actinomadura] parvosata subsp. kistnae]|uniref:NADP oxidoreductase n=1 Tax=[Actinomadura] parvosata subsp. kistnae TaxID=1909395 RepID=A0A1V0AAZ9_9ACTN|nr:NADPH-dependent F420 reductase [Nonomuraea sp. ATCC 55076]AQZ67312.1 NADP oxidoreductase [Nonomuraea sp. ATCC 55076]SPL94458.1 (AJ250023) putative polyketide synthase [Actinomadura parvosata subsp. kistnae]